MEINWRLVLTVTAAVGAIAAVGYASAVMTSPKTGAKNKSQKKKQTNATAEKDSQSAQETPKEPQEIQMEAVADASFIKDRDPMQSSTSTLALAEEEHNVQSSVQPSSIVSSNEPLSEEEKEKRSIEAKEQGNDLFKAKKYLEAIVSYTAAIELMPTAVYYGNRAACFMALNKYDEVIQDCTEAIGLDERYIKAYVRRLQANLKLGNKVEALRDYSILCILSNFQDEYMRDSEALVQKIAQDKAPAYLENKQLRFPSMAFCKTYFESFKRSRSDLSELITMETTNEHEEQMKQAFQLIADHKYQESFDALRQLNTDQEKVNGMSDFARTLLFNFLGTFYYLMGDRDNAGTYIEKALAINPNDIDTLTKKANFMLDNHDFLGADDIYTRAEKLDSDHSDIYYHRGQLRFITGVFQEAIENYKKVIELDPDHLYGYIQLAVAYFKMERIGDAEKTFARVTRKFSNRAEVYLYRGEMLIEQNKFDEAMDLFTKAQSLDKASPLPLVNQAIVHAQIKSDPAKAEELLKQALNLDEFSEVALMQLGNLYMSLQRMTSAVEIYERAANSARNGMELVQILMMKEAASAQMWVAEHHPMLLASLGAAMAAGQQEER